MKAKNHKTDPVAGAGKPRFSPEFLCGPIPATKAWFAHHEDFAAMANEEYEDMVAVEQATREARRRILDRKRSTTRPVAERVAARDGPLSDPQDLTGSGQQPDPAP